MIQAYSKKALGIDTSGTPSSSPPVSKDKDGKFVFNFILPDGITSQQKLGKWLVEEMGIKSTSPEYRAAYKEYGSTFADSRFQKVDEAKG